MAHHGDTDRMCKRYPARRWIELLLLGSALTVLVSCGSGGSSTSPTPAADNEEPPAASPVASTPTMPALHVIDVVRTLDGSVSIEAVDRYPGQEGVYRPLARKSGEYLLLGYVGADIVDAVPLSFDVRLPHDLLADGEAQYVTLNRVTAQLKASAERIEVLDEAGAVVASLDNFTLDTRKQTRLGTQAFPRYPWISLLSAADALSPDALDNPIWVHAVDNGGVMTLDSADVARISALLDKLPPRIVSAITTLAFGGIANGVPGIAGAGHILISSSLLVHELPGRLNWVLTHEAAHAYHNLSSGAAGQPFDYSASANWPTTAIAAMQETHREFGFDRDVLSMWREMHAAAVSESLAAEYQGLDNPLQSDPFRQGFVTSYAATIPQEDFADTVAVANIRQTIELSPEISSGTCTHFQTAGAANIEIDKFTALAYTKLRLVQAMELATDEAVDWCLGDSTPTYANGIHLGEALLFDRQLNAGYTGADRQQFNIVGQDVEQRGLAIELGTEGRRPIGVYPLDLTWWASWNGSNTLVIASPDDFEARTAVSGVVVVTYARSDDRVEGFVFNLELYSAFGPASRFDFVPFLIPL